jgi:Flp pilus assembly protein TadD
MLIPLGLCLILVGRMSHLGKIVVGYAVVAMVAGVVVTFSRGGWLVTGGIMLMVCVVLLFQQDYRLKALVLLAVLTVCGLFLVPEAQLAQEKMRRAIAGAKVDDVRFSIWWSAFKMWQAHPWWGVGPGHFDYRFNEYRLPDLQMRAGYAHNEYLNTLADWGAAGAAVIAATLALLYAGVFKCWKFVRGARDDFARKKSNKLAFAAGASLGLLAILTHALLDFTLQLPANAILAVTLMALLSSQWRFATEGYWFRAGVALKCAATLALLAGLAELGRTGWQEARESRLLYQANKTLPITFARIAALEKAFAADTNDFDTAYAIGECYKTKSFLSESDDPSALARTAIIWYERAAKLNPYDAYSWLRWGMCLDWIGLDNPGGRPDTASYYERANALDPNGYFTTANTGWHYVQIGDYAAARTWLGRSDSLEWDGARNEVGRGYLAIVEKRLEEAATAKPLERRLQSAPAGAK